MLKQSTHTGKKREIGGGYMTVFIRETKNFWVDTCERKYNKKTGRCSNGLSWLQLDTIKEIRG